jgi:hypothetical protein
MLRFLLPPLPQINRKKGFKAEKIGAIVLGERAGA